MQNMYYTRDYFLKINAHTHKHTFTYIHIHTHKHTYTHIANLTAQISAIGDGF